MHNAAKLFERMDGDAMQWNGMEWGCSGMEWNGMEWDAMEWGCENHGKRVSALIAAACP